MNEPKTPRERADAIVQTRDIGWQALRDLIQGHIEEAVQAALRSQRPEGHVYMGCVGCEGCHVELPDGTRCDRPADEHVACPAPVEATP